MEKHLNSYISAEIAFFEKSSNRLLIVRPLRMFSKIMEILRHIFTIRGNEEL